MISRRTFVFGALAAPFVLGTQNLFAQEPEFDDTLNPLEYPDFAALDGAKPFGYSPPTEDELQRAKAIIQDTPSGPTPLHVARSFYDRFFVKEPKLISQWPKPNAWNPLVVEFFTATTMKPNNDMVAWCAAFANWCLQRANRKTSRSASSQSFLSKEFPKTNTPKVGDLAIFTCFDVETGASINLGHVGFVASLPTATSVELIGGNQSADGHSSIISLRSFSLKPRRIRRTVNGRYTPCDMKLNSYVAL